MHCTILLCGEPLTVTQNSAYSAVQSIRSSVQKLPCLFCNRGPDLLLASAGQKLTVQYIAVLCGVTVLLFEKVWFPAFFPLFHRLYYKTVHSEEQAGEGLGDGSS